MSKIIIQKIANCLICVLLCNWNFALQSYALSTPPNSIMPGDALNMAEILGVRAQLERIHALNQREDAASEQEMLTLKSQILQKILIGEIEVREAASKNWRELSYSFNILRKEERKQKLIDECFTLANFAQLSALYTTEPFLRLDSQFKASAICTQVGGGLALGLPIMSILQQKMARVKHVAPSKSLHEIVDGGPVDASGMPIYVDKFFDSPVSGMAKSHREEMFGLWKKRYGVDVSKADSLCSLCDERTSHRTIGTLHVRILLLYSVRTYILDMDNALLALLKQVISVSTNRHDSQPGDSDLVSLGLNSSAVQAAKLLDLQAPVMQLVALNRNQSDSGSTSYNRLRLEITVLERTLRGALEARVAADQIDAEINYASDVVLSELLSRRGRQMQKLFEANFIQAGTFGSIAGLLYLKNCSKAGTEMFLFSSSIGTVLSALGVRIMRGGTRPIDTMPNSLSDVFLISPGEYRLSPLMTSFLNSASPEAKNGATRREELMRYWHEHKVTTINLEKKKNLAKLAACPPAKLDTITIATNRIAMLHKLLAVLESFDAEILELLYATENKNAPSTQETLADSTTIDPAVAEAANVLKIQSVVNHLRLRSGASRSADQQITLSENLILCRRVFTTMLDVRADIDNLDDEIAYESDLWDRLTRNRDQAIAWTNNLNFFQLNILGIIIDGPTALSSDSHYVKASNILNIVSGLAVGCLAAVTVLEQKGACSPLPIKSNVLRPCLGMAPPGEYHISPEVWQFINDVPPASKNGRTRLERMKEIWKEEKAIYPNMDKEKTREKMAACGAAHTRNSDTIKVIRYRLKMLYDVQGMVGLFFNELDGLLRLER